MCLGIPMQIIAIEGHNARCSVKGVEREVSLFLLQDRQLQIGDFVMVHVGYAIEQVLSEEAERRWLLHDEMNALSGREDNHDA